MVIRNPENKSFLYDTNNGFSYIDYVENGYLIGHWITFGQSMRSVILNRDIFFKSRLFLKLLGE